MKRVSVRECVTMLISVCIDFVSLHGLPDVGGLRGMLWFILWVTNAK